MKNIALTIKEPKCDDKICPMPMEFLPNFEIGIKNVKYSKKTGVAGIDFDEKRISSEKLVAVIKKMGYGVTRL